MSEKKRGKTRRMGETRGWNRRGEKVELRGQEKRDNEERRHKMMRQGNEMRQVGDEG